MPCLQLQPHARILYTAYQSNWDSMELMKRYHFSRSRGFLWQGLFSEHPRGAKSTHTLKRQPLLRSIGHLLIRAIQATESVDIRESVLWVTLNPGIEVSQNIELWICFCIKPGCSQQARVSLDSGDDVGVTGHLAAACMLIFVALVTRSDYRSVNK